MKKLENKNVTEITVLIDPDSIALGCDTDKQTIEITNKYENMIEDELAELYPNAEIDVRTNRIPQQKISVTLNNDDDNPQDYEEDIEYIIANIDPWND